MIHERYNCDNHLLYFSLSLSLNSLSFRERKSRLEALRRAYELRIQLTSLDLAKSRESTCYARKLMYGDESGCGKVDNYTECLM